MSCRRFLGTLQAGLRDSTLSRVRAGSQNDYPTMLLSVAIMAFGIGVFYLTLSGDLTDAVAKRSAQRKGWGLVGCFVAGLLIAGL